MEGVDFCTFGMFIIDEIHYQPPRPPVKDILGGAGTYAALGARVLSPPPLSKSVGWVVDAGNDFPARLRSEIAAWQTSCLIRETPWRNTTRGWNGYGENEERAFKYTTPKLRLDQDSLDERLLLAKSFHLICSPSRCIDLILKTTERRRQLRGDVEAPLWVWEPVPDLCTPEQLHNCYEALKVVDVVSPNDMELSSFFGIDHMEDGRRATGVIERCCADWLHAGIGFQGQGAVVVRAGKDGCYISTSSRSTWIPAFHKSAERVVDPTGGGNAFLGAMTVTLARESAASRSQFETLHASVLAGSIGASFAIEQVGMPRLTFDADGQERWNNERPAARLDLFKGRLEQ